MRLAKDKIMWAVCIGTLAMIAVILYTPLSGFLKLAPLSAGQLLVSAAVALAAVLWYEIVKLVKRVKKG